MSSCFLYILVRACSKGLKVYHVIDVVVVVVVVVTPDNAYSTDSIWGYPNKFENLAF